LARPASLAQRLAILAPGCDHLPPGQARKRDDLLVNAQSNAAEVVFTLLMTKCTVQRSLPL
jgi:hypothetical protein